MYFDFNPLSEPENPSFYPLPRTGLQLRHLMTQLDPKSKGGLGMGEGVYRSGITPEFIQYFSDALDITPGTLRTYAYAHQGHKRLPITFQHRLKEYLVFLHKTNSLPPLELTVEQRKAVARRAALKNLRRAWTSRRSSDIIEDDFLSEEVIDDSSSVEEELCKCLQELENDWNFCPNCGREI